MSVRIKYRGRSGNNLLQFLVVKLFCERHGLQLDTYPVSNGQFYKKNYNIGSIWNVDRSSGLDTSDKKRIKITDNNFHAWFNAPTAKVQENSYTFYGFFQQREIFEKYWKELRGFLSPTYDERPNDEVFVAYRIGDLANTQAMLPLDYYVTALKSLNFSKGYITSDSINHPNILKLSKQFNLEPYSNNDPMCKINFAKNFRQLILSEGSFSFLMGFLSKAENIICSRRPLYWHGDLFFNSNWVGLNIDWHPSCVSKNGRLIGDTAIQT